MCHLSPSCLSWFITFGTRFNCKFCWGIYYLLGVGMERKNKNFASKGAKTAMSLVLALSLVPSSALAEIASTQEVTQTQEVAATQTSDATASTSEATAESSTEATTTAESTSNQQTSEQTAAPADRSSRRVTRSLSYISRESTGAVGRNFFNLHHSS